MKIQNQSVSNVVGNQNSYVSLTCSETEHVWLQLPQHPRGTSEKNWSKGSSIWNDHWTNDGKYGKRNL